MIKCTACNGHKTIIGMGGIRSKCKSCAGIGFSSEAKENRTVVTPIIKKNSKKVIINSVKIDL